MLFACNFESHEYIPYFLVKLVRLARTSEDISLTHFFNKVNKIKNKFVQKKQQQEGHILCAKESNGVYWRCNHNLEKTLVVTIY